MPVVPQVDVDSLGSLGEEHHDVHRQADGNDECTHRGVVCHGSRGGPSHVEDAQAQAIDFSDLLERFAQAVGEQSRDDRESHKTHADEQSALERFSEFDTDTHAEYRKDDRHHDGCPQTDNVAEYCFHAFVSNFRVLVFQVFRLAQN